MFLSWVGPRSVTSISSLPADLPIGVLRKTNCARLRNALKPRGDIYAIAHKVAVALLDDIADVNANAKLDPAVLRHAGIALNEAVLNLDCAANRVHDTAKLDNASIAGAFDDAAVVGGDGGVDEVAAQASKARERAILVRSREPAIADDIGDQDAASFRVSLIAPLLESPH